MAPNSCCISFLIIICCFLFSTDAHTFNVGDEEGWKPNSCRSYYQSWADAHRFRINDQLVFGYEKGSDSVLIVSKDDYYRCNRDNPMKIMRSGNSKFKLTMLGKIYFISGHDENCEKGQKFVIDVSPPEASPVGCGSSSPPSPSPVGKQPVSPVHAPSVSRGAPVHAPSVSVGAPVNAPRVGPVHAPAPSQSRATNAPVKAPPVHSPSPSPAAKAPTMKLPPTGCPGDSPPPAYAKTNPHSPLSSPATSAHMPPVHPPYPAPKEAPTPPVIHIPSPAHPTASHF